MICKKILLHNCCTLLHASPDRVTTIPTDIGILDYLGREIILSTEKSDWTSATKNYQTSNSLWNGLKAQMSSSYKADIDTFQNYLDVLKSAIDNKDSSDILKTFGAGFHY